jgi:STE24 endopeptidase
LFVKDLAKRLSLALIIGGPLVLALLTLMERAGRWWWLPVWAGWLLVTLTLSWAWPRYIAPLFNRFSPLTDEALSARVDALLDRCGFTSDGLFVVDGSRRSAHGNAYFSGLGRNKRIVLFDTLLERLDAPEVEAVLAHELGHFRLRHMDQRLALSAISALAAFALLAWFAGQPDFFVALGVPVPSAHSAALLFMLMVPAFLYFVTPLLAWWSRRHEFAADDFAVRYADAEALASALVKLYRGNATTLTPDPIYSAFYDSHPSALVRIAKLNAQASYA